MIFCKLSSSRLGEYIFWLNSVKVKYISFALSGKSNFPAYLSGLECG